MPSREVEDSTPDQSGVSEPPSEKGEPHPALEQDDAPYVPRVFAFDPNVPAELIDPPEGVTPARSVESPQSTEQVAANLATVSASSVEQPEDVEAAEELPEATSEDSLSQETVVLDHESESQVSDSSPLEPEAPQRRSVLSGIQAQAAKPPAGEPSDHGVVDAWSRPDTGATAVIPVTVVDSPSVQDVAPAVVPLAVPEVLGAASAQAAAPGAGHDPFQGAPPGFTDYPPEASAGHDAAAEAPSTAGASSRPRWILPAVWTAAAVLLVLGLYGGAQWFFADTVPRNTAVAGVSIGGLHRDDAIAKLTSTLGTQAQEPVTIAAGEGKATIDPKAAGLSFDPETTVDELASFSLRPSALWRHLAGAQDVDPVVAVDRAALQRYLAKVTPTLDVAPIDGEVQFVDGKPTASVAVPGLTVNPKAAADDLVDHWLRSKDPIAVSSDAVEPEISQAETDAALAEAEQVIAGPVMIDVGGQKVELPPESLASAAIFLREAGALHIGFNGEILRQSIIDRTTNLLSEPDPAHFVFQGGAPQIEGGQPGTTIDPQDLATTMKAAATGTQRTISVEVVPSDPADSVAALQQLGIKERISSFSTPLTSDTIRTKNIVRGTELINGVLIKPGQQFSLVEHLSPVNSANGYVSAGVISNGRHIEGMGGGLSQVATTTFNAAYDAGLMIDEFRPHTYWFTRYPAGRESTVAIGSIDVKFTNDTPYGVLVQAWVDGGKVHVALWSTKHFTVEATASGKSNVVPAGTREESGPECEPSPRGQSGFTITNYRKVFAPDGAISKDESRTWTYKPDNGVVCVP